MKIQPITLTTSGKRYQSNKNITSFNGGWKTKQLNILNRDEAGMRELGRYFWSFGDEELQNASTIRNSIGLKKTSESMQAFHKLKTAVNTAKAEFEKILKRFNELSDKKYRTPAEDKEYHSLAKKYREFQSENDCKKRFYEGSDSSSDSGDAFLNNLWEPWNNTY